MPVNCAHVWVWTHTFMYIWVCHFFLDMKQYLDIYLSMWTFLACLYACVRTYLNVWHICQHMPMIYMHMCICVNTWKHVYMCKNVNVCVAYVSIHAYECVHVRLCVAHQHSCVCVTVCLLYESAHVFECVWVSILSEACLGIVSIWEWVFLSTVSILAPKCVFIHTQRYVWVCVCVYMGACLRDEEDTG